MSSVNTEKLLAGLQGYIQNDADYAGLIDDLKHGIAFERADAALALAKMGLITAEKLARDIRGLDASGGDKLDAVVGFLDGVIELPFYLEMFDGPAIKLLINTLLKLLNAQHGHGWYDILFGEEAGAA